jgi:ferredoxin-NADP reductase
MAEQHTVKLLMSEFVTHDVKRFLISKPSGFSFEPGQGMELAISESPWQDEARPFIPTSLTDDGVLEFTIKRYSDHEGMTRALHRLPSGTELLLSEPFGTISYQGPGVFIAGGAGITPFTAILREHGAAARRTRCRLRSDGLNGCQPIGAACCWKPVPDRNRPHH